MMGMCYHSATANGSSHRVQNLHPRNIPLTAVSKPLTLFDFCVILQYWPYKCSYRKFWTHCVAPGAHIALRCRGLKVLVDLLDEDYAEESDLVVHALNGIGSVFELQSPTTKNDFCRMFIREGLLDPLSAALLNVMTNKGGQAMAMKKKIIQIVLVFCQVSQSDIHIRNALGTRKVIRRGFILCDLRCWLICDH